MEVIKYILVFYMIFFLKDIGYSRSFIGGEAVYECLGVGQTPNSHDYKVTFTYYSDCNGLFGDWVPTIQLYSFIGNEAPYVNNSNFYAWPDTSYILENSEYNCLNIPAGLCIRKTVRSRIFTLPIIDESYHFSHQIGGRTEGLSNVIMPIQSGATIHLEITPEAQIICNNTPKFATLPPTIVCVGETVTILQNIEEQDGDQIIYSICPSLNNASTYTDLCFNDTPLNCPPPYESVPYLFPEFTSSNPLGQSSEFTLNQATGELTITPEHVGFFVYSICVEEYRNGVLLSKIRREFQLSVGACTPTISAELVADQDEFGVYNMILCNTDSITVDNQSYLTYPSDNFYWTLDKTNYIDTVYEWSPNFHFDEDGSYVATLHLNPDSICSDFANVNFEVTTDLTADFETDYDTCVAGPISMINFTNETNQSNEYLWNFGDGYLSSEREPSHQYIDPGIHSIQLIVENDFFCKDSIIKDIVWQPAPPILIVNPNFSEGCAPLEVAFNNLSSPLDSTYKILWTFENSEESSVINPRHIYQEPGISHVSLSVTSPIGCQIDSTYEDLINVEPPPVAHFDYEVEEVEFETYEIIFNDNSERAEAWQLIYNLQIFYGGNATAYLEENKSLPALLEVQDKYGCLDSFTNIISIPPKLTYFLPNAFTPNNDGVNDTFIGVGLIEEVTDFKIRIYDRWGQLVFHSNDPELGWDGSFHNSGTVVKGGVYIYYVSYKNLEGEIVTLKNPVTLIK